MQIPCRVDTEVPTEGVVSGGRHELGTVFRGLAEQWECQLEEGHLMPDHVHRCEKNMAVTKVWFGPRCRPGWKPIHKSYGRSKPPAGAGILGSAVFAD
jgi:hypothetical protein